ncbi:MAG TPA: hypothetical protein VKU41_29400 [Polyangiaceae bacterium]|nr:hypothetical protein [Polyangiaceae bacterium]
MRTTLDDRTRDEARRYAFRFACDDCVHFDGEQASCSLAYPAAPRRDALERESVELCKSFELA